MDSNGDVLKHALYLPSTPLNVLLSAAHAVEQRHEQSAALWLIDQKRVDDNPYYEVLQAWPDSPFEEINLFRGTAVGWRKLAERRENFQRMQQLLESRHFSDVLVGSDRRVEFQYIMHLLSQSGPPPKGHYLDDGLYSYAGRPYHPVKDRINAGLKKLFYGAWWQEPYTIGASAWINDVWVMAPDLVCDPLKAKNCHRLPPTLFTAPELATLSEALLAHFDESSEDYRTLDVVILLSHPNNIQKMPGYETNLKGMIEHFVEDKQRIAVKYHPRMQGEDAFELKALGVEKVIPSSIAFEFLLPLFKPNAKLFGDVGSSLLMAKWLRPDLDGTAILDENNAFQRRFLTLFQQAGLPVKAPGDGFV